MPARENADERTAIAAQFPATHWSVVLNARHRSSPDSQAALEQLCRTYWHPLDAYLRRSGHNEAAAEDLIQSFFRFTDRAELGRNRRLSQGPFSLVSGGCRKTVAPIGQCAPPR